jgi:hypothetical protein
VTSSTDDTPKGELTLYQTEDGQTRIECRFEGETRGGYVHLALDKARAQEVSGCQHRSQP